MLEKLKGKKLLASELLSQLSFFETSDIIRFPGIQQIKGVVRCFRCGHMLKRGRNQQFLEGNIMYYCSHCIQMGKVDESTELYHLPNDTRDQLLVTCTWEGELTIHQHKIAKQLVKHYQEGHDTLVHAVTGAGKTEMLYPLILEVISHGGSVCLAAPRTDVCIELFKRISPLFTCESCLIYGGSDKPSKFVPLIVCTTHQLYRYYQAFDCLVLDEVDAFPFRGNPSLEYAVDQSVKLTGKRVLLTATPSAKQLHDVKQGLLKKETLFLRYHGRPLPVPDFVYCPSYLGGQTILPKQLQQLINQQLTNQRRTLIFVPTIATGKHLSKLLKKHYPTSRIANVSSVDHARHEKVEKMRDNYFDLLVTTTILERGVTFSDIDVIVFGAHHPIYNTASLVQIAGRVGRKNEFPNGHVYYLHEGQSLAMKKSRKQIKLMNRIGALMNSELSDV
ncbi:DEAD/DEAH box helicase [Vagococcus xieshaowenii]|nr:DEAD/DEAH box helicase [Vagococcus xieshaowenii]